MLPDLQVFSDAAATDVFVSLSLVFALSYAAFALWLIGREPVKQHLPSSLIRRAL